MTDLRATNFRQERAPILRRDCSLAIAAVIALQTSGCVSPPNDAEPLMEAHRGERLDVTVDGIAVEPEDVTLWSARLDEQKLVLVVPESGGCTIEVKVSDVHVESKIIDVMAMREKKDSCAANLVLSPKELIVDTDVRGFTVNIRVNNG